MKKQIFQSEDTLTSQIEACYTVQDVITVFEKFKKLFGENATVTFTATGWEEQFAFTLGYYREETDKEYSARLEKESKDKDKRTKASLKRQKTLLKNREMEKLEYERLKAIYGDK